MSRRSPRHRADVQRAMLLSPRWHNAAHRSSPTAWVGDTAGTTRNGCPRILTEPAAQSATASAHHGLPQDAVALAEDFDDVATEYMPVTAAAHSLTTFGPEAVLPEMSRR